MCALPRLRVLLVLSCLCSTNLWADRIMFDVTIAGQTTRLALDTGSEKTCLFSAGARRLGLAVEPPRPEVQAAPGKVAFGLTEECDLEIGPHKTRARLPVVTLPGYVKHDVDGVIGWDFIGQFVTIVDSVNMKVAMQDQLPPEMSEWSCWQIPTGARRLFVEIPAQRQALEIALIDTGTPSGVMLAAERWRPWAEAHALEPGTLDAAFYPGKGIVVCEERWACVFALEDMTICQVPVGEYGGVIAPLPGKRHTVTLGLRAVRCLSWAIDAPNGKVYFQPHGAPACPNTYEYNRLGAVFVPGVSQGDALVAHVITDSPAYRAGIRNGDALLRIGDLDTTKWRTDPRVLPLARFWSQAAGTTLHLGLQRGAETLEVDAVLEDIFPTQFTP